MPKKPKYNLSIKIKDAYYKGALWEAEGSKYIMSGSFDVKGEKCRIYVFENTREEEEEEVPF